MNKKAGMGKYTKLILIKIAKKVVIQGDHKENIMEFNKVLIDAARNEFTEDNNPTLDSFLKRCFDDALTIPLGK